MCIVLCLACVVCTTSAADCTSALFNSITSYPADSSAILLYSERRRPCDEPTLNTNYRLSCPASNPYYTRFAFALAASGPDNISGVCFQDEVFEVAPAGIDCRQYYNAPSNQPTLVVRSIAFAIATTRVYSVQPFTPVNPSAVVPFAFAQFSANDTEGWCSNVSSACDNGSIQSATMTRAFGCDADNYLLDFGVRGNDTVVLDHCGNYSDPPGDIITTTSCQMACCAPCGASTNVTRINRVPIGPSCSFNVLGAPKYLIYGGARIGFANDPPGKDSVRFQQRLFTPDGEPYFIGGLTGTSPVFVNNSRHMRVSVGAVKQPPSIPAGYLIICDLNPAEPISQGPGNPYIQNKVPSPCLSTIAPNLVDDAPLVAPANADPATLGAGIVPTAVGQGPGARASFFFIPEDLFAQALAAYPSLTGMFLRDYLAFLFNGADAIDPDTASTRCPGSASAYFTSFVGVPGWELDPDTLEPLVKIVCQMSHEVNFYRYMFFVYYNQTGDARLAEAMADENPGKPPWLFPRYNISGPNVWLNDNNVVEDIGETFGQRNALEMYIDAVESEYLEDQNNQFNYVIDTANSQCFAAAFNGTGVIQVSVLQTTDTTDLVRVQLSCSNLMNTTMTIVQPDNSTSSSPLVVFAAAPGQTQLAILGPFTMRYNPNTTAMQQSYVGCSWVLVDETGQPYGDVDQRQCVRTDTFAGKSRGYGTMEQVEEENSGIPQWAFWTIVGVVIGGIIVTIIIVGIVLYVRSKKNTQKPKND